MTFELGTTDANKLILNTTEINKIQLGSTTVYDKTGGGGSSGWAQVGNAYQKSGSNYGVSFPFGMSSSRVALFDRNDNVLKAFSWDGTDFAEEGNDLTIGSDNNDNRMYSLSGTRVIYSNNGNAHQVYDYTSGVGWSSVGSSVSLGNDTVGYPVSSSRVIFHTRSVGLRMYTFNGSTWTQVGNTLSVSDDFQQQALCVLDSTLNAEVFLYYTDNGGNIEAYSFDGTNFTASGNTYSAGNNNRFFMAHMGGNDFAYIGQAEEILYKGTYSGGTFTIDTTNTLDLTAQQNISISPLNGIQSPNTDVFVYSQTTGLKIYRYTP